jgi:hypothetical protein
MSTRQQRHIGYRCIGLWVGLLALLLPCTGVCSEGKGRPAEATRERRAVPGLDVRVHDGRLSVDVRAADLGEVLAQIGRQASIQISTGPSAGTRVSAQFSGAALEEGLRRLLRLASLSHLFLYAPGPGGSVVLAEVRVWGEGNEVSPRQATITAPGLPNHEPPASPPGRRPRRPAPAVVEQVPPSTSDPEPGEPTEAMRRVLDVFQQSRTQGAPPTNGSGASLTELTPLNQGPGGVEEGAR